MIAYVFSLLTTKNLVNLFQDETYFKKASPFGKAYSLDNHNGIYYSIVTIINSLRLFTWCSSSVHFTPSAHLLTS
ncbi:hypothetical protein FLSI110296_16085 [Flavobacterium sinopsychrotolerans]|uniref:Uncharacterized protein n=1 Tax=Flavobacterium sinopsychrotolerans TaxID=604089 RepID=A0A1H8RU76_9FLAO|nr:hypothetical protein SAMN04487942_0171 [Flavobacterium sinopsychrotolerans]